VDNLKQVKEQVEKVLEEYPAARDSDKLLEVIVLQKFYKADKITDLLKANIPNLESIRRCRQKIQADGKYPAKIKVRKGRHDMQEVYEELAISRE
jgi:hypothetical protein